MNHHPRGEILPLISIQLSCNRVRVLERETCIIWLYCAGARLITKERNSGYPIMQWNWSYQASSTPTPTPRLGCWTFGNFFNLILHHPNPQCYGSEYLVSIFIFKLARSYYLIINIIGIRCWRNWTCRKCLYKSHAF